MVVVSYVEFQEYQERRRQPAVEPARPEPSQATELPSPADSSDTPPHQEPGSQTRPPTAHDVAGDVRLMPRTVCDF